MRKPNAKKVALAFAKACSLAGQSFDREETETASKRAENLIRNGYILDGDPHEWAGGKPCVTIYCEQKGGSGDCIPPADYYDRWPDLGSHLPGYFWEWNNAAVAHVWPV